jgi:hypothetical protein
MKKMKFTLTVVCMMLMLAGVHFEGQAQRDKGEIVAPQKGKVAKEEADLLAKDGWKTDKYTIEEQLASTWMLMCTSNPGTGESRYLWVEKEATGENLKDIMVKNYISGITNLTYQLELPFISQCKIVMLQKKASLDQMERMEKIVRQVSPMVVQNMNKKSMEIYRQKDKTYTIRSVYMIDKSKAYDILCEACIKDASANKENATLVEIFKEALNRMAKQSIR